MELVAFRSVQNLAFFDGDLPWSHMHSCIPDIEIRRHGYSHQYATVAMLQTHMGGGYVVLRLAMP
jgi:bifunctional ADP-heptose synthase (sugar kinase/adenylyltransferase)